MMQKALECVNGADNPLLMDKFYLEIAFKRYTFSCMQNLIKLGSKSDISEELKKIRVTLSQHVLYQALKDRNRN
ncbi:MAG: hypothetical protein ACFFD4_32415 [Candidatus Odinarchaeota archaeon]